MDDTTQGPREALGPEPAADPSALLATIELERDRAGRELEPDARLIYGVWGAAWLVGFLIFWVAARPAGPVEIPMGVASLLFAGCLAAAMVTTGVHIARRVAGVRGVSARVGAMYGWAWFLAFVTLTAAMSGAVRQGGISDETVGLLWSVLSGLVVGTLYLAGGALWQDSKQYGLGVWILVSSAVGAIAGYPSVYLVMALGGGGGFLLAAAFFTVRHRVRP